MVISEQARNQAIVDNKFENKTKLTSHSKIQTGSYDNDVIS